MAYFFVKFLKIISALLYALWYNKIISQKELIPIYILLVIQITKMSISNAHTEKATEKPLLKSIENSEKRMIS